METTARMRESLQWALDSRQQWTVAYQQALDEEHSQDADFAATQIAVFDRIIRRQEKWLEDFAKPAAATSHQTDKGRNQPAPRPDP